MQSSAESGAETDDVYQSKWSFFHSLEFLRDSIFPRKTTCLCKYDNQISIIKYSKYQSRKYSKKALIKHDNGH